MRKRLMLVALVALAFGAFAPEAFAAAKLRVLHAAPDVGAVTVYVNGAPAIPSLGTLESTPFLELPAGSYDVAVNLQGQPAATAPLKARITLRDGRRYTALARGLISRGTAELALQQELRWTIPVFSLLRVWHLSPDAPNVDVYVNGFRVVRNLAYTDASGYLPLPAGTYDVRINVAGTATTVFSAPVTLAGGTAYSATALGSVGGSGAGFTVSVLEDAPAGAGLFGLPLASH